MIAVTGGGNSWEVVWSLVHDLLAAPSVPVLPKPAKPAETSVWGTHTSGFSPGIPSGKGQGRQWLMDVSCARSLAVAGLTTGILGNWGVG